MNKAKIVEYLREQARLAEKCMEVAAKNGSYSNAQYFDSQMIILDLISDEIENETYRAQYTVPSLP